MKTTEVYFEGANFVGREIENIQDLVKALDANMEIATEEQIGYCSMGEREVTDEDGDTRYEEYEKTDEELFNEMQEDLKNGTKLYAGFFLNCYTHKIVEAKNTTLQSDFNVGQEVFFMKDNKIQSKYIFRILLNKTATYSSSSDRTEIIEESGRKIEMQHEESNIYTLAEKYYYNSTCGTHLTGYRHMEVKKEREIFATKEELVKHLMEE